MFWQTQKLCKALSTQTAVRFVLKTVLAMVEGKAQQKYKTSSKIQSNGIKKCGYYAV